MPSAIDISSNALLLVGDNPISSFSDPGAGAQAAANLYPQVKQRFLSYTQWSFALKQQRLNLLSEKPDTLTGWESIYQLPTDLIRLWAITPHADYSIIGDKLYTNNKTALLATYIHDVNETALPAHAVKALEYMLASEFAISVTEDDKKAQLYEQKGRDMMAQASTIDAQSRPQQAIVDSPFVNARFGGNSHGFF